MGSTITTPFYTNQCYKEVVTKCYHLETDNEGSNMLEDDEEDLKRLLVNITFTAFNGSIAVGPLRKSEIDEEIEEEGEEELMIRVEIETYRPEKDSPPVVILQLGSLGAEEVNVSANNPTGIGRSSMGYAASMKVEISEKICKYVALHLHTSNGKIHLADKLQLKQLNCKTSNSGVEIIADCTTKMNITTSNGSIEVYSTRYLPVDTVLKTSNGSIVATLPEPTPNEHQDDESLHFSLRTSNSSVQTNMTHKILSKKSKTSLDGICESRTEGSRDIVNHKKAHLTTSNGKVHLLAAPSEY